MIRDMYARNLTEEVIKSRIVEEVDTERFRQITNSTLEGLAKRELNLSAIVGKSAEAKERRLVPEVIEDFFVQAAPIAGLQPQETAQGLPMSTASAACPAPSGRSASGWSPASASWAASTSRSSSTRRCLPRTPPWNGSRPAIRCSRASARMRWIRVQDDLRKGAVFYRPAPERARPAGRLLGRHP